MLKHFFTQQFLLFVAVGVSAALIHWLSRILLSIWFPFTWAVAVAYGVGITVAFLLNSYWVFPRSTRSKSKQARDFIAINLAFFPVVWIAAIQIERYLRSIAITSYSEEFAHGLAISVPILATFLIYKFFAFREDIHE